MHRVIVPDTDLKPRLAIKEALESHEISGSPMSQDSFGHWQMREKIDSQHSINCYRDTNHEMEWE